ncbi:MAG TPA: TolC family protein, partial [Micropepsaceae bacterium]|nr:TolC family protein [Micropepsaceae bacterium]
MFLLAAFPLHAGAKSADGELPLTVAIARALEADPRLRAAAARIIAAEGSLRQAGARPNPVLSVEAENFSGTGPLSGYSGAETSVTLSFEIEAGGQGEARVALAGRERELTELERILQGLDLIRDVEIAYAEALGADELRAIAIEQAKTAEAVRATVRRRVAAAREPLMAGVRADASAAEAQVNLSRTELQFQAAMMRLASYWGGGSGFSLTSASMQEPSADGLEPDAFSEQDSLDLLHLSLLRGRAAAATEVERTRAIPNPTVTFGWRRLEELDGDGAFMGGVSIPL